MRKFEECDDEIGQKGVEDSSDHCQSDADEQRIKKAHLFPRGDELIVHKNLK